MKNTNNFKKNESENLNALKLCLEELAVNMQKEEMPIFNDVKIINYYASKEQLWTLSFCMSFYNSLLCGDISRQNITGNHWGYHVRSLRESIIKKQKNLPDDVLFDYRELLKFGNKLCEMSAFFADWIIYVFLKQHDSSRNPLINEQEFIRELENEFITRTHESGKSIHISMLLNFFNIWLQSESKQKGGQV